MKCYLKEGELATDESTDIYDITKDIEEHIRSSEIKNGHVLIQPLHTTVGIFLNENEEGLFRDLDLYLSKNVPERNGYFHDDLEKRVCPLDEPLNGHSHIKASLYSNPSLSLIVSENELQLGRYQRILFAEFDGPCPRKHKDIRRYLVSIIGE